MKKIFLFLVVLSICSISLNAQLQFSYGLKAGANFSTLLGEDAAGYDMLTGAAFGGLVRLSDSDEGGFLRYVLHSELYYSMQGAKSDDTKITLTYLHLPIMIQRYIASSGFFVETGPQVGILLSAKYKQEDASVDIKSDSKKIDFSLNVGLGYSFNNGLGINARYGAGLTSVSSESKARNVVISVGLFYVFGQGSDY